MKYWPKPHNFLIGGVNAILAFFIMLICAGQPETIIWWVGHFAICIALAVITTVVEGTPDS